MSTPEKELQHCSTGNQMTNHLGGNCLKHSTPEIERVDEIRAALARGYCSKENEDKVLDPDLIEAMALEIEKTLTTHDAEAEAREKQLRDIHKIELDTISCMSLEQFVVWRDQRKKLITPKK